MRYENSEMHNNVASSINLLLTKSGQSFNTSSAKNQLSTIDPFSIDSHFNEYFRKNMPLVRNEQLHDLESMLMNDENFHKNMVNVYSNISIFTLHNILKNKFKN